MHEERNDIAYLNGQCNKLSENEPIDFSKEINVWLLRSQEHNSTFFFNNVLLLRSKKY
jgi:hypothetical protein